MFISLTHAKTAIFTFLFIYAFSTQAYFDSVSLVKPSSITSSSYCPCSSGGTVYVTDSTTIYRESDPFSLEWLLARAKDGPVHELTHVRENQIYFSALLENYIADLEDRLTHDNGLKSSLVIHSAILSSFFALWTAMVTFLIIADIREDYLDGAPHSFAVIPALIALIGPAGLTFNVVKGIKTVLGYKDLVKSHIAQAQTLLYELKSTI